MAEAYHVPIVIEQAVEATPGETLREDGTLVIDIKVPAPCNEPELTTDSAKIVVCASRDGSQYRIGDQVPDQAGAMEEIHRMLNLKIGPVELGSIRQGDGTYALGVLYRF